MPTLTSLAQGLKHAVLFLDVHAARGRQGLVSLVHRCRQQSSFLGLVTCKILALILGAVTQTG